MGVHLSVKADIVIPKVSLSYSQKCVVLPLHLPGMTCHPVAPGCSCSLHLRVQGIKTDDSTVGSNHETGLAD